MHVCNFVAMAICGAGSGAGTLLKDTCVIRVLLTLFNSVRNWHLHTLALTCTCNTVH